MTDVLTETPVAAPENRGTLTLTPDGRIIVGLPHDTPPYIGAYVGERIALWREGDPSVVLVLPFPVDVIYLGLPR